MHDRLDKNNIAIFFSLGLLEIPLLRNPWPSSITHTTTITT